MRNRRSDRRTFVVMRKFFLHMLVTVLADLGRGKTNALGGSRLKNRRRKPRRERRWKDSLQ